MSTTLDVAVAGMALWNPDSSTRPQPSILPPNERRRAPDTVAIALQVAHEACVTAGRDPAKLATVFASTYGDLPITDYMCATLASAPATLSPTRFHNSVHNAAAGYWSIATGSRMPYCALAAGPYTFGAGLLTAAVQVCADQTDVLYVAYDTEACGPLARVALSRGMLGMALVLSAAGEVPLRLHVTADPPADSGAQAERVPDPPASANAMAAALRLHAALRSGVPRPLTLPLGPALWLRVRVRPG